MSWICFIAWFNEWGFFYIAECSMPIEVSIFLCFINNVLTFES